MKINDARLNLIRADLEKYKEIRKAKNILYKKDAELEHSINRNILLMTHGEDVVDQIESLVGKRIAIPKKLHKLHKIQTCHINRVRIIADHICNYIQ